VATVYQRWGGIDILVNNAGITYYGRTEQMSAENWDQVLRVNLLSHIQFTREFLPTLLARREAHILNVGSIFGLAAMPKLAAYCTTKFAMVGFTESLRAEFGREGLGITALCPGFVSTNLFTSAPLPEKMEAPKVPPDWLCTTPERVADAAVRAIYRDKRLVVVEPFARLLYFAKRFFPGLIDQVQRIGRGRRLERRLARSATAPLPLGATGSASANPASVQPVRRAA
jgi:short-subunit dehydrogenase